MRFLQKGKPELPGHRRESPLLSLSLGFVVHINEGYESLGVLKRCHEDWVSSEL